MIDFILDLIFKALSKVNKISQATLKNFLGGQVTFHCNFKLAENLQD